MSERRRSGSGEPKRGGHTTSRAATESRELRIIGGRWRGRHWRFPEGAPIRPTPDRVRETLFNWLMHSIVGADCIDAFAGSGALGLEALSRGAARVRFVDANRLATQGIRQCLRDWQAVGASVLEQDALGWLETSAVEAADIVFLDPPFAADLLPRALAALHRRSWLRPGGQVYLESEAESSPPALPPGWMTHRSGRAGAVSYHLLHCGATPALYGSGSDVQ